MLRRKALRKIIITTFVFFVVLSIYMIPSKKDNRFNTVFNYVKTKDMNVYLLNDYNQLTRLNFKVNEMSLEETIKSIISKLTISKDVTIPSRFIQVIPEGTNINRLFVDEGIVHVDFSNSFLDIKKDRIRNVIEAISYSLFELDKISGVSLYIDGKNVSNYYNVPDIITKDYGINKRVMINDLNDVTKVVIYYMDDDNESDYYVPITKFVNDNRDKIKIIIDELSSNYVYESNLVSLLDKNIKLLGYEIKYDSMILDFNNSIFINQDKALEEVSYSVFANYDVSSIIFKAEGKEFAKKSTKVIE